MPVFYQPICHYCPSHDHLTPKDRVCDFAVCRTCGRQGCRTDRPCNTKIERIFTEIDKRVRDEKKHFSSNEEKVALQTLKTEILVQLAKLDNFDHKVKMVDHAC